MGVHPSGSDGGIRAITRFALCHVAMLAHYRHCFGGGGHEVCLISPSLTQPPCHGQADAPEPQQLQPKDVITTNSISQLHLSKYNMEGLPTIGANQASLGQATHAFRQRIGLMQTSPFLSLSGPLAHVHLVPGVFCNLLTGEEVTRSKLEQQRKVKIKSCPRPHAHRRACRNFPSCVHMPAQMSPAEERLYLPSFCSD